MPTGIRVLLIRHLSLRSSHWDSLDELPLQDEEDDDHRQRTQQCPRYQ